MSEYQAPLRDMQFAINELAALETLNKLPGFEDATPDMVEAILEQAGVLANEVFSPINYSGNEHGTHIENGTVVSPPGFKEAYQQFVDGGWNSLASAPEYGGMGLPECVGIATIEMWSAANISEGASGANC